MADNSPRQEIDLGLLRMQRLMEELGNPQDKLPVIQIAGTNGKGSTGVFISLMLKELGLKVGHYSSPAVFDPMEIISIDGDSITEEDYNIYKKRVLSCDIFSSGDVPTAFEVETAIAYLYLVKKGCDVLIIEAGMGGDLDATNITNATIASVLTPVGLDHTRFLGDTIGEIAGHKAGIIKPCGIVMAASQTDEAINVFRERAEKLGALFAVAPYANEVWREDDGWSFTLFGGEKFKLRATARYQVDNAVTAISLMMAFRDNKSFGFNNIGRDRFVRKINSACMKFSMPGRMEIVHENPLIIIDGAHNPPAARALRTALDEAFAAREKRYVFGAFRDKEFVNVFKTVYEGGEVVTVTAPGVRGVPADELADILQNEGINAKALTVKEAAAWAKNSQDMVVSFGSLSWIAAFKEAL